MANPNKTVEKFRRSHPFPERASRPRDPFVAWVINNPQLADQVQTIEQARAIYDAEQLAKAQP